MSALIVARKEFRETVRDGRFRWGAGLVVAILTCSVAVGWYEYTAVRTAHETAQAAEYDRWLNKGVMSAHWAARHGMHVFKVPTPFSSLDIGVSRFAGTHMLLEAERQGLFQDAPSTYERTERRLGEITAAATVETLMPLLIVLLLFGAVAGERDAGTLRQIASLGVPPGTIAVGKILGAIAPLLAVMGIVSLLGALALVTNVRTVTGDFAIRAATAASAYILYGCWFVLLTLTISMFAPTARHALVVSLIVWFAVCLVFPRLAAQVAASLYPEPTPYEFAAGLESDRQNGDPQRYADLRLREALRRNNVSSADALPANALSRVEYLAGQIVEDEILSRHVDRLFSAYRQQERIYHWGGWFSPTIAIQALSMALAGTDIAAHEHFWRAARRFGFQLEWTMHEDVAAVGARQDRGREVWERVPPFHYQPVSAGRAIMGARHALVGFSCSLATIGLLAVASARRLRV
jgi:ABC-2 type transport system permease protein